MSYVTLSKYFLYGSHKKKSPHIENYFSGAFEILTRDLLRDRQALYPTELTNQKKIDRFKRCVRDSNS